FSRAMKFRGGGTAAASNNRQPAKGSFVEHHWNQDLPMFVSALALAGKTLYVAGPPDMVNEEESFARLTERDPRVQEQLAQQAAALEGQQGSLLWAVRPETGERLATIQLPALPTWDGMAAARGRLYLSTQDGKITCWTERP
ncbi:MAG: PQQ-binding-like beta-propeller repeat protein, partial [Planctomycetales bacterium]|nr:PQQ-binding-like beta-propeller repeat protein [Planctomycetales bacterium]